MKPQQCLFFQESNNCNNNTKDEHIIQRGLAGTLSSPNIICANCNNFFSHNLDNHITDLYDPIIKILSPFLSGKLKHRKKRAKLTSEILGQYDIEYVGGSANLAKINKKYYSNGHLKIIAPCSYSKEKLEEIAEIEGVGRSKTFRKLPFTELFPDGREKICLNVTHFLIRAILLDILELDYHVSVTKDFPCISKHCCLNELRLWIRTGNPSKPSFLKNTFPWCAPVSDLLDPLFEPSTFSHRLVICFDHKSRVLILIAQFVNTMPWVFVLENIAVHSRSLSILYKKALIDGQDQLININHAVLDISDIRWHKFSTNTHDALEFAKTKWKQEFKIQNARAHYEFDLRNDNFISERLTYYTNNSRNKINPSIDAVVKLVQNRYQGNRFLPDILEITRKKVSKEWTNSGNQKERRVLLYRECLKTIKSKFGYPKL
ncbi:MAG: HNH endonuclease [Planctomycetota bacterium]|jgi:hypothetical protein